MPSSRRSKARFVTVQRCCRSRAKTAVELHRELGKCWGKRRQAAPRRTLKPPSKIRGLRDEFGKASTSRHRRANVAAERAGRVADFMEFGELLARDALTREESCGGHFREEYQYEDGEAKRDDEHFAHVAAWEHAGEGKEPIRNVEPLTWDFVKPSVRSYK